MTLLIITLVLVIIGLWYTYKRPESDLGAIFTMSAIMFLITYIICILMAINNYHKLRVEGESLNYTLNSARMYGNPHNDIGTFNAIADYNKKLAKAQYLNSVPFLREYVDNRTDELTYIY